MRQHCLYQYMKLCFQVETLRLSSDKDLILYEGDSNIFDVQRVKIPYFNTPLTHKHSDPIFLLHFFNVHIMNVNQAKFQIKFESRKISRELPQNFVTHSQK